MVTDADFPKYNYKSATPQINKINISDLGLALKNGYDDFKVMPTYAFFMILIIPVLGYILVSIALNEQIVELIFPMLLGFSFIGPITTVGLYELSRRREQNQPVPWHSMFAVFKSPSIASIIVLGLVLFVIFVAWLWSAQGLYELFISDLAPKRFDEFMNQILYTNAGHQLIIVGNILGGFLAALVFTITVVSFPLLVDRYATAAEAVVISAKAVYNNLFVMIIWALIIAIMLCIGMLTAFLGLIIILPILGHATWHLYRKIIKY